MDKRKILLTAIAFILIAGFLLRFFPVRGGYHYWDETVYLQHAEILTGESPNVYNEFEFRPPLFSLILAGAFFISSSLLSAHLTVAGLSSLVVILVYIIGKELYSRETGIIAAAIYAASPMAIILSHDILVDPILPIFWLLTAFSLTKALRSDKRIYFVLTGLMASLAVLMKFTSLVIVPAVLMAVLIHRFKDKWDDRESLIYGVKGFVFDKRNWLMVLGFIIGFTPYLIWSFIEYGSPIHVFIAAWAKSGARDAFITYLNGWNSYLLIPFYVGIPLFFRKIELSKLENYLPVIFFFSLFLPLQFIVANKETRFLMPILPFMVLIAAEGLRKLKTGDIIENRKLSKGIFAFLIVVSLIMLPSSMPERNVFAQGFEAQWEAPVMDTGNWLDQNTDEDALVYTNYQYPALGYYAKRNIVWFREYVSIDDVIGEEITEPGYLYYSKNSPYPHPSLEKLQSDSRFELKETFGNTSYIFYYSGEVQ